MQGSCLISGALTFRDPTNNLYNIINIMLKLRTGTLTFKMASTNEQKGPYRLTKRPLKMYKGASKD